MWSYRTKIALGIKKYFERKIRRNVFVVYVKLGTNLKANEQILFEF